MNTLYWILGIIVIGIVGFYTLNTYIYNEKQGDTSMQQPENNVHVIPIEHASMIMNLDGTRIYVDPVGDASFYVGYDAADLVLVTDIHGDHFSTSTLEAIMNVGADLVVPKAVMDLLPPDLAARAKVLSNGEILDHAVDTQITAVPMYNLPGASNANFHTKGRGNGYIIEKDGFRVYIAGDTAGTPEMRAQTDIDIAFVPMNLPYTMSVEEAADAVLAFKPSQVYPYHYRGPDGLADVAKFKQLVAAGDPAIDVILANWYPKQ